MKHSSDALTRKNEDLETKLLEQKELINILQAAANSQKSTETSHFQTGLCSTGSSRVRTVNKLSTTKIMSYIGENEAPNMFYINKRCCEVTLKDVKKLLHSLTSIHGTSHYYFRTHDSEYGLIKEEIFSDDAYVPSWEGAVMVWVEDEKG